MCFWTLELIWTFFSSSNLFIPSEVFPQWILVCFSTPVLKGILFLPVQHNLQESVPTLVLIILSQYYRWEIPQTKFMYLWGFFQITFKYFKRHSFKAILASICRLPFVKALPQYTTYEIYVQVMVFSLHFKYWTEQWMFYFIFSIFQIFINQRSSYIFLMVFKSQAGMFFSFYR